MNRIKNKIIIKIIKNLFAKKKIECLTLIFGAGREKDFQIDEIKTFFQKSLIF